MNAITSSVAPAYCLAFCHAEEAGELLGRPPVWLSGAERALYVPLPTDKRRRDWLAGRKAAKRAVARLLENEGRRIVEAEIEVLSDEGGRPFCRLAQGEPPQISLSHCARGGLAAASRGPIGVDWETIEPREPGLAAMVAGPGEDASTPQALTALWATKEAVLKMLGLGISEGLREVRWIGALKLSGRALARWRELGGFAISVERRVQDETAFAVAFRSED